MPRCLMAKKWKAYPWPDRQDDEDNQDNENCLEKTRSESELIDTVRERRRMIVETEDEEIDVVGDSGNDGNRASQQTCWGPHSPTAGTTAPSPPPLNASGALYYHGNIIFFYFSFFQFFKLHNSNYTIFILFI